MTDALLTSASPDTAPALGRKVSDFAGFDKFKTPPGVTLVTLRSDEFTSLCPVTGQPDYYVVEARYMPHEHCLESKTFKLYLQSFRSQGMFSEALASVIAHDISAALQAIRVTVTLHQKPRGGVGIETVAEA